VGPALGGALSGTITAQWALAVVGVMYAISAVVFFGVREPAGETSRTPLLRSALAALRYVVRHATLRGLAIALTTLNIAAGIVVVALPVIVLDRFHGSPVQVGLMWALQGVSGVAFGLVVGRLGTEGKERGIMAAGAAVTAFAWGLILLAPNLWVLAVAAFISGFATGPFDVALFSLRQRRTDRRWFGRAFAISMSLNFAGFPIGSALAGPLIQQSMNIALLVAVGASLLSAVLVVTLVPTRA
jgi:MFS family permease